VLTELAAQDPERIALVCGEEAISRGDLEARANRLAWAFEKEGVRANDFVSLVLPNGIELVSAMLASWKLGAVPNPLAPAMPAAEPSLPKRHRGFALPSPDTSRRTTSPTLPFLRLRRPNASPPTSGLWHPEAAQGFQS
jgi:bile acid-coenzyme A ligase